MSQQKLIELPERHIGDVERDLKQRGMEFVVGIDEAGRGPLAGPVVAAAFALDLTEPFPDELDDLDDSKKLELDDRERLYEELTAGPFDYAIGSSDAAVIDEINILQATFRAMRLAVDELTGGLQRQPDAVLVDGNLQIPKGPPDQRALVEGDGRSLAIAAASVIAKVHRDRQMCRFDKRWPQYGFASHKGYGTSQHREALREHGPCVLHRRSFAGVDAGDQ